MLSRIKPTADTIKERAHPLMHGIGSIMKELSKPELPNYKACAFASFLIGAPSLFLDGSTRLYLITCSMVLGGMGLNQYGAEKTMKTVGNHVMGFFKPQTADLNENTASKPEIEVIASSEPPLRKRTPQS